MGIFVHHVSCEIQSVVNVLSSPNDPPVRESIAIARLLLVADTHIGFDQPPRPRIERRRRVHDFLANFERALEPAMNGLVDAVIHGGDLFFRSKVGAGLVEQAMQRLIAVARHGVPVFLVPGNHERSRIPLHL